MSTNNSQVPDPKWTGVGNEIVVCVSRGEPRRTDEQMIEAIAGQITLYLLVHGDTVLANNDELISATVELIAQDYVRGEGSSFVWLYRDHMLGFVAKAVEGLDR